MTLFFIIIMNGVVMSSHEVEGNNYAKCVEGRERARATFEAMVDPQGPAPLDAQFICVFRPAVSEMGAPA